MIEFKDSFGFERGIDFNLSMCGKFVNLTIYTPSKSNYGNTLQINIAAFRRLVDDVNKLERLIDG